MNKRQRKKIINKYIQNPWHMVETDTEILWTFRLPQRWANIKKLAKDFHQISYDKQADTYYYKMSVGDKTFIYLGEMKEPEENETILPEEAQN